MSYYDYDEYVTKYSDKFKRVLIDSDYSNKISCFAEKLAQRKLNEYHHLVDNCQGKKRFYTGLMGEAAIEKLLGIDIIDWTIGESEKYHHPDVPGYNVGIKTVEKWKYPIIFKDNWYPQIMCILSDKISNLVFVCGLADKSALNAYQSDELVLDKNLLARGTKTAFWGFKHLMPINSIEDIENYKK